MVTVRLNHFGGSVTSTMWTSWTDVDGVLDLYDDKSVVVTTFAKGSWSYVHNLEDPPEMKMPNYPAPIQPPVFGF